MYTIHRIGWDRHWQQFNTTQILISALQWLHRPYNAARWFYRVGKKPSVKADLATYSHVVDVSGQCVSVSLITLGFKLDFSSCAIWDSFCKSSHVCSFLRCMVEFLWTKFFLLIIRPIKFLPWDSLSDIMLIEPVTKYCSQNKWLFLLKYLINCDWICKRGLIRTIINI